MELVRATEDDADLLSAVGGATFLESFIEEIPGREIARHINRQHNERIYKDILTSSDPRYACWLLLYPGTQAPVGYLVSAPPDLPVGTLPSDIELKRIYLFSRFQGSGAASQLHNAFIEHACQIGAQRLLLGTYERNARAISFYHKQGYRKIGLRKFQVGDVYFDDIVMAKEL